MDFSIIEKAGLNAREFADIVGVKRITAYSWVKGRSCPNPSMGYYDTVVHALRRLDHWVEAGKLPRTAESRVAKKAVVEKIKEALSKVN